MTLFSIITISYQNCDGLRATVESVARQTFRDFEHIVVDGGSTDGSADWLAENFTGDWTSEKDNGRYDAMNKGAERATGEYLWFLHSGDIFGDVTTGGSADKVLLRGGLVGGDVELGAGNDTFRASAGAEVLGFIRGQDDNDRILGSSEDDRVEGGGGFDTIKGRGGDDEIKGGAGEDVIVGGAGDDEMTGGSQGDEFRIGKHSGADTILDWQDGVDVLNLRKLGLTGGTKLADVVAASENRAGGAVIIDLDDLGGDGSITVENWNTALMTVDDFIF